MELAILLRNCQHDSNPTDGITYIRYALKCDTFSIQIAKTPIQVPIPQDAPELIDIGFYRPSISIGGIVDTIGEKPDQKPNIKDIPTTNSYGMEYLTHLRKIRVTRPDYAGTSQDVDYYLPTKNLLEEAVYKWVTSADDSLELEVGDATFPVFNRTVDGDRQVSGNTNVGSEDGEVSAVASETGGGVYVVAIQQCRFQVDPAQEDRWQFQMQLVCQSRKDVKFS